MPVDAGGVRSSWIKLYSQNKASCVSMSAAWMIFISGGMKIAWGVYEQPLVRTQGSLYGGIHLMVSWFVGVIIGVQIATLFVHRVSKNVAHYSSGVLIVISGMLFTWPFNAYIATLAARYLDGIAFGLSILQAIVTGGEVSNRFMRGSVLSTERIFIWIGIAAQLCLSANFFGSPAVGQHDQISIDQIHGTIAIVLGFLAILCSFSFPHESPIYLQVNDRETASMMSLRKFHRYNPPTKDIVEIFEEQKQWLRDTARQSFCNEIRNSGLPFLKLAFLRSLVGLAMALPFHWAYILTSTTLVGKKCLLLALALAGVLGSLLNIFFMDCQGRRASASCSLFIGGTLLLSISGIYLEMNGIADTTLEMMIVASLIVAYECINAFGFAPTTTVYMSEAFALPLKIWFIAGIIWIEHLVQVITCILAFTVTINFTVFFGIFGILNCIAAAVIMSSMPETRLLTLSECYYAFSGVSKP